MFVGIVLAGGRSSRMGCDKALLQWQGHTQLENTRQKLLDAGCDKVVISRNEPGFVQDRIKDAGPLAGVHACLLSEPGARGYLIAPVDMPLLKSRCLRRLLQAPCAAHYDHSVLPCYLPKQAGLAQLIEQQLQAGKGSVHAFLKRLHAEALPSPQAEIFINTNTPEEWQALSRQASHLPLQHKA